LTRTEFAQQLGMECPQLAPEAEAAEESRLLSETAPSRRASGPLLARVLAAAGAAALFAAACVVNWGPETARAGPAPASHADALALFRSRADADFPWEEHIANLTALRHPEGLPRDLKLVPASLTVMDKLGGKLLRQRAAAAPSETITDQYLRVSACICDVSLVSLKMASALLSIEGATIVCPKAEASYKESMTAEQEGARRLEVQQRRRLFDTYGATAGVHLHLGSGDLARMACAANVQAVLSGFLAVSQYVSQAVYQCPVMVDPKTKDGAGCSMALSVLTSGLTKSTAAASDVAQQCRDPATTPYSLPIASGQQAGVRAACMINVGQASTYLAKVGLSMNGIVDHCKAPGATPNNGARFNWWEQAACGQEMGGEFANIGQVATYLAAAASDCGTTILVPFACANRAAAIVTGLADIVQGAFGIKQYCIPPGQRPKTTAAPTPAPPPAPVTTVAPSTLG